MSDKPLTVGRLIERLQDYPIDSEISFWGDGWGTSSAVIGRHKQGYVIFKLADPDDFTREELGFIVHAYMKNPLRNSSNSKRWRKDYQPINAMACGKDFFACDNSYTKDWGEVTCEECLQAHDLAHETELSESE